MVPPTAASSTAPPPHRGATAAPRPALVAANVIIFGNGDSELPLQILKGSIIVPMTRSIKRYRCGARRLLRRLCADSRLDHSGDTGDVAVDADAAPAVFRTLDVPVL